MKALVVLSEVNSIRTIGGCLESLVNQDFEGQMKIVVVDGGSTDGTLSVCRGFPEITLIVRPGCSETQGQQLAIDSFKSYDLILVTNSDCYVPRHWISSRIRWHELGYSMVGGKLFWGGDAYGFTWSYITPEGATEKLGTGLSLGFSNCSFTRELYDSLGGFREMKSQHDMDFFARALKADAKIILDPSIEVYHDHPMKSFSESFVRSFCYGFNHVVLLRKLLGRNWRGYMQYPYAKVTLLDALGIHGVRIYKQQIASAESHGIRINLASFILKRQLGEFYGTKLGWIIGLAVPLNSKLLDVRRLSR